MQIRKFLKNDMHQVAQIFYDTIHSVNADHYNEEQRRAWAPAPTEASKQAMCKSLLNNICYVAELDGQIIGFGDLSHEGYLDRFYTHKDHQGKGVATLIGMHLYRDAKALGITEVTSEVSESAKPAALKRGFKVIRAQDKVLNGMTFRNYLMKISLEDFTHKA